MYKYSIGWDNTNGGGVAIVGISNKSYIIPFPGIIKLVIGRRVEM